ncbi:MAG: choice-of-anchor J domain-containing protein [Bacteroidales bacterium]|nr:choice-of-anchor J domain-containing protein [Bacteroidales bacterium]
MKKSLRLAILACALMAMPAAAVADTLTVATGNQSSVRYPFMGAAATSGHHVQLIYKASLLTEMVGGTITQLSFYVNGEALPVGDLTLRLAPTTADAIPYDPSEYDYNFIPMATADVVYSGPCTLTDSIFTITFTTPYTYDGGNLVMDLVYAPQPTGWNSQSLSFRGMDDPDGDEVAAVDNMGFGVPYWVNDFTPMATFIYQIGTCPRPGTVAAATTLTGATLRWPAVSGAAGYRVECNGTAYTTTDTFYTVASLAQGIVYTASVSTLCGDGDTSAPRLATFQIPVEAATVPYATGFEPGQDSLWMLIGTGNRWHIGTGAAATGSRALYISYNGNANTYASGEAVSYAYRRLAFPQAGTYTVSFDWRCLGEHTYDYMRAFLAPDTVTLRPNLYPNGRGIDLGYNHYTDSLENGWIDLGDGQMQGHSDWTSVTKLYNVSAPQSMYLLFMWVNDNSDNYNPPAAIDNVDVDLVTCFAPLDVTIDTVAHDYIGLSWRPAGNETEWAVTLNDGEPDLVNDTAFYFTDLTPSTDYTVSVRAVCSVGDTSLALSASASTPCAPFFHEDLPIVENFNSYDSDIDHCWHKFTENSPSNNNPTLITVQNHGGAGKCLRFYPTGGNRNYLVMPEMDNFDSLMLSFWLHIASVDRIRMQVGVMTDPTDPSTFQLVYTAINTMPSEWTEHQCVFTSYTGTGRYIAFRTDGANALNIYLDDITLDRMPECARPMSVSVSNVTATSADVDIDNPFSPAVYHLYLTHGDVTDTIETTTDTYTLQGLLQGTAYSLSVGTLCSNDSVSATVGTSFLTEVAPAQMPYSNGFETGDDLLWFLVNGPNAWSVCVADTATGNHALTVSAYPDSIRYSITSPTVSYAVREVEFEYEGDYICTFNWKGMGEEDYDYLRVWLAPATSTHTANIFPNGTSPNTLSGTADYINTTPAGWIDLADGPVRGSTAWQYSEKGFTVPATGIYKLVLMWANDPYSGSGDPVMVDNLDLHEISCPAPSDLTLDQADTNALDFHWTSNGNETTWSVTIDGHTYHTPSNYFSATDLTPGTAYDISVRAVCGPGDSSLAVGTSFTTTTPFCAMPTDLAASNIDYTAATIAWIPGDEESEWDIEVGDTVFTVTAIPFTFTDLDEDTQYEVRVRSRCSAYLYSDWSASITFTTLLHVCHTPVGLTTVSVTDTAATLAWSSGSEAIGWELALGDSVITVASNPFTLTGLQPTTRYTVKVRSHCTMPDYSDWSDIFVFYTTDTPEPCCEAPIEVTCHSVTDTSAIVVWEADCDQVQQWIIDCNGVTAATVTTTAHLRGLDPATGYTVRIMADCGNAQSDWSTPVSFTTLNAVGILAADGMQVTLQPNPASVSVTVSGLEPAAQVALIDMNGREIGRWQSAGTSLAIDLHHVARGAYFVRIADKQGVAIRKLIVK